MTRVRRAEQAATAVVLASLVGLAVLVAPTAAVEVADTSVRGSMEQVATWGHVPGTAVELLGPGGQVVDHAPADAQGAVLFRHVAPGAGYAVRTPAGTSDPVTVTDPDVHPGAEAYPSTQLEEGYGYLPTRDGTLLSVDVSFPVLAGEGPWPVVVNYSGYDPSDPGGLPREALAYHYLGYVVVGVNMRGTGCSGGAFDYFEPAQLTDGYDVIETLAGQSWSNGDVGMVGISYSGISQLYVASTNPPHLDAITPLSPYSDAYRGILYPGGIRNEGFAREWALDRQEAARPAAREWARKRIAGGDTTCRDNQVLRLQSRDLDAEIRPDRFDDPEQRYLDLTSLVGRIQVPTYLAAQFQDEQTGGSAAVLAEQLQDRGIPFKAVFANGTHVEPMAPQELPRVAEFVDFYVGRQVPDVNLLNVGLAGALRPLFGDPIRLAFNRFDPSMPFADALAAYEAEKPIRVRYEVGGVAGLEGAPYHTIDSTYDAWPVPGTVAERWYLQPDGVLDRAAPSVADDQPRGRSSYVYDPDEGRDSTYEGGTEDMWKRHPDVHWDSPAEGGALTFTTPPADARTVYAGTGSVDLWIRSDAPDTDIEAVLTEVRPDGHEVYVQSGWLRASHRALDPARSTELSPFPTHWEADAAPLPAGEWSSVRVPLFPFAHIVRPGSRLRLSIEAPGGNQPFWAFTTLPGTATDEVAHSAGRPSSVALPRIRDDRVTFFAPSAAPSCAVPGVTVQGQSLRGQPCRADRAPRRPTGVLATPGAAPGSVQVTWGAPPSWPGAAGPTGYEVTVSPGGATATVGPEATSATVTGLPADVPLSAVVRATFADGAGPGSDASPTMTLAGLGPEERFVEAAYQDFLGRAPTEAERSTTAAALVAGTTGRRGVVAGLAASTEWSTAIVADLYLRTLDRPGDAGGTAYWAERIRTGQLTVARVAARLYSSPEYLARFPAGDLGAWVDDLYTQVLGRPSDPAGRAHWLAVAARRGPAAVALSIYQSPESARARVRALYAALLGRAPDAGGLAFWAGRVVTRGDVALAVDLASGPEYLARAQRR